MTDRMGLLGLAVFVIAVMGIWTFLVSKTTQRFRNSNLAAAAGQFWPG
jgi:hypothetical protein